MSFKKANWINNTDVYEVNLRQYSQEGTFKAFQKELPRLMDMGVTTLWFMPITPISQKHKKGSYSLISIIVHCSYLLSHRLKNKILSY